MIDRELAALLIAEIEQRLSAIHSAPEADQRRILRHAIHAIKGAAGMAGARDLAARCGRLEDDLQEGTYAGQEAETVVHALSEALARLRSGGAASAWPKPDADLRASRAIDPAIARHYATEVGERLAAIDEVLARSGPRKVQHSLGGIVGVWIAETGDGSSRYDALFRHVHTLKGAASAAGDAPLAWFCHGLEDALRALCSEFANDDLSEAASELLARFRPVLAGLVAAPDATLDALRGGIVRSQERAVEPVQFAWLAPATPAEEQEESRAFGRPDPAPPIAVSASLSPDTVRVSLSALESVSTTLSAIARDRERALRAAANGLVAARRLRALRSELSEALRLVGPPRPWGAPAAALEKVHAVAEALGRASSSIEADAWYTRTADAEFRGRVAAGLRTLSDLERVPASGLFARFRQTVDAEARRMGKTVRVLLTGGEELVERRLFEALQESLLQLARNALAHGVESSEVRVAAGKEPAALVRIEAARRPDLRGERLVVAVSDDGPGVDLEALRRRAEELGYEGASDTTRLLRLLLLPGLSTIEPSEGESWLAGRGVGLDVVHATVRALGGELFLSTAPGRGFRVEISVPTETTFLAALVVKSAGYTFAIPASAALSVAIPTVSTCSESPVRALAEILGLEELPTPSASGSVRHLTLLATESSSREAGDRVVVAVDAVVGVENGGTRPLGHQLAALGPYSSVFVGPADVPWPVLDVEAFLVLASRRAAKTAGEPPRAAKTAGEPPRAAKTAGEPPRAAKTAGEPPRAAKSSGGQGS